MIPELREGLEQWFNEKVKERPDLDEQRIEELERLFTQAWKTGRQVVIRYWDDGERDIVGRIVRLSWFRRDLKNEKKAAGNLQTNKVLQY